VAHQNRALVRRDSPRFAAGVRVDDDGAVTLLSRVIWVGLGGMAGSVARYLLSAWLLKLLGPVFPFGTLAVNLIGSFLLGALLAIILHTAALGPGAQLGLTTGVMGGFTTYSAFNYETLRLLEDRAWALAGLYVAATLLGCLAVGWLGWHGATWLLSGRAGK
jgi:fluoride exporter